MADSRLNIHVLRHGVTTINQEGLLSGQTDTDLSARGVARLNELVDRYRYPAVDKLYSSPLKRCVHTAAIIYPAMKPELVDNLKEIDFGVYNGTPAKDLLGLPEIKSRWKEQDDTLFFKGGESICTCRARGIAGFRQIIDSALCEGVGNVGIIMHNTVMRLSLEPLLDTPIPMDTLVTPNGMGYSFFVIRDDARCARPLHFVKAIPESAPRPAVSNLRF